MIPVLKSNFFEVVSAKISERGFKKLPFLKLTITLIIIVIALVFKARQCYLRGLPTPERGKFL
jgi:hypothetical protein